jgi:hypothetical protein
LPRAVAQREDAMIRTAIALAMLLASSLSGLAEDSLKKEPFIIGDAVMEADGTIIINLRRTADGIHVTGRVTYPVSDPRYREVLDHLGGMNPGETKLVPAWDDPTPPKQ